MKLGFCADLSANIIVRVWAGKSESLRVIYRIQQTS